MIDDTDEAFPLDFERLFTEAVSEILRHEDPQGFRQWMYQNMHSFITPGGEDAMDADGWRALATVLGLNIWNSTPLPGNRFHPKPLPRPGRNDRCSCGSGLKYKNCCGDAPPFEALSPSMMWRLVLDALSPDELAQAIKERRLPIAALIAHAAALFEDELPQRVVELLAPLFEGDLKRRNADEDAYAFDLLLNAYDDLPDSNEKDRLIERITNEVKRSPLSAAAWQRLSSMRMDEGDSRGAWEAFEKAQRDQPNSPGLAHLELLLLSDDGRIDEVPERARMWIRRLRRQGFDDDDELIAWLREIAEDPKGTLTSLGIRSSGNEGQLLRQWLMKACERSIKTYVVSTQSPGTQAGQTAQEQIASNLQGMGIPAEQIEAIVESMILHNDDEDALTELPEDSDSLFLAAPAELRDIEGQWHEVFPCAKPFSTQNEPFDDHDPWSDESAWTAFLDQHPQAADSVDILDDLASALMQHPMIGERSFTEKLLIPILDRAVSIVEETLANKPGMLIEWGYSANRPILRCYSRRAEWAFRFGDPEQGLALSERLCALNPHDNHGVRCILMDEYLHAGRDDDAVALAARFADDTFVEIQFGNVLALYRLGHIERAHEALIQADALLPEVLRYLLPARSREPKGSNDLGVVHGSKEQAWLYRVAMRDEWVRSPGALDWLKAASRHLK